MSGLLRVDCSKVPRPPAALPLRRVLHTRLSGTVAASRIRRPLISRRTAPSSSRLPSRPELHTLKARSDAEADFALRAYGLQRDGLVRTADQHIAAEADAD